MRNVFAIIQFVTVSTFFGTAAFISRPRALLKGSEI